MRRNSRAIIVRDGKLLVLKRNNNGNKFFVIPGGKIDEGETAEQAAEREALEETSVKSKVVREVFQEVVPDFGMTRYFLCDHLSGEPALHPDSEEAEDTKKGDNTYEPMWVEVDDIAELRLLPNGVAAQLIHDLEFGFSPETRIIEAKKEEF